MDSMGRLAAGVIFLPLLYAAATRSLKKEKGKPAVSLPEIFVLLSGEAAVAAAWLAKGDPPWFPMAVLMTAFMNVFCKKDYWEMIVPNRLLLILLFLLILYLGFLGIRDMDAVMGLLVPMVLGFVFCAVSFGLGYLLSHGSMGAGDVKLSLVMGLSLTGSYVVGTVLYGCIAAAAFSLVQLMRKKLTRKDTIPFVPFLYIGLVINCLRLAW